MTDTGALGASDATTTVASWHRHQIVLLFTALAVVTTWLLTGPDEPILPVVAIGAALLAVPTPAGRTVATQLVTLLHYLFTPQWHLLSSPDESASTSPWWEGELIHHGRLDLSGRDAVVTRQLEDIAITLAQHPSGGSFAIHVDTTQIPRRTVLRVRGDIRLEGWRPLAGPSMVGGTTGPRVVREQWRHVHTVDGVTTTMRIVRFAPARQRGLLDAAQRSTVPLRLTVQGAVLPAGRALRLTGRAVHRDSADGVATATLGFRRSARRDQALERIRRREQLVAQGAALLQVGVFLTVAATTAPELRSRVRTLRRHLVEAGLVVDEGRGRQWQLLEWSLPGGPP